MYRMTISKADSSRSGESKSLWTLFLRCGIPQPLQYQMTLFLPVYEGKGGHRSVSSQVPKMKVPQRIFLESRQSVLRGLWQIFRTGKGKLSTSVNTCATHLIQIKETNAYWSAGCRYLMSNTR